MGRKALLAVFCWLGFSGTSAKNQPVQTAYGVIDNISAESVPRLYRNVPVGVYASATPYAAYSFNVPTYVAKSSNAVPVKAENVIVQNANGYLKDSYGQRFIETPHTAAYKSMFPQQFVELQKLPAHLKQPLVAAAPSLQYGLAPHFFGQTHLGVTNLQTFAPSNINQFSTQPLIYANNVRSLAPTTSLISHFHGNPETQQQSTGNNNIYINKISPEQINSLEKETKFQRLQEPKISYISGNHNNQLTQGQKAQANTLQLVQVPKQTSVTTVTNGKKTVINLITKPPVPLLDLTLLEPLTFKNPLVPQVQHFLPRIHQATYKKLELPEINEVDEVKKHQMEIVIQKTKSYDSGVMKGKSKTPKKTQKVLQSNENEDEEDAPPSVTVHELSEENPDISYEVKTPNYHETYTEQKMSYNKETTSQPVNISYDKKTENEPKYYSYEKRTESVPIQYSYSHSSDPTKQINKEKNDDNPKHLVYQFKPEEQNKENQEENQAITPKKESEESSEDSSEESDDDEKLHLGVPLQVLELVEEYHQKTPHKAAHITPEHKEEVYYQYSEIPSLQEQHQQHQEQKQHQASPHPRKPSQNEEQYFEPITPEYEEDIIILPTHKPHSDEKRNHNYNIEINHDAPQQINHPAYYNHYQSYQAEPQSQPRHNDHQQNYHAKPQSHPRQNDHQQSYQAERQSHPRQNDHQQNYQTEPQSHPRQNDHQQSYEAEPQSHPRQNDHKQSYKAEPQLHTRQNDHQQSYQAEPQSHLRQNHHQQNYQVEPRSHPHQNKQQQSYQAEPQSHPRQNAHQQSYQAEPRSHPHQNKQEHSYQAEPQSHPRQNDHQQNYEAEPRSHPHQNKQEHSYQAEPQSHPRQNDHQQNYEAEPRSHEKNNRIIVKDEPKSEIDRPNEELMEEMVKKQEESEEDFEKAYKDAAYGFPAYDISAIDVEKEIYNPNTYGASRYHNQYDIVKSPLRQYEADGDLYPAFARLEYKDVLDKTSDGYFDEYEVRRPESLRELNKQKENYYENYKKNKPEKYTAAPAQEQYYEKQPKQKQSAKYREAPLPQKYTYKKESQRDNSAHASRPQQRYKSRTQFVEPQYQYGFEPVSIPRLLDSELAAMASNTNPKSDKLDTRKKIITENFYYKKTSKAGKAGS